MNVIQYTKYRIKQLMHINQDVHFYKNSKVMLLLVSIDARFGLFAIVYPSFCNPLCVGI